MAILLKMEAGEIELFHGLDLSREQSGLGGVGDGTDFVGLAFPCEHFSTVAGDFKCEVAERKSVGIDTAGKYLLRRYSGMFGKNYATIACAQRHIYLLTACGENTQLYLAVAIRLYVHQQIFGGVLHGTEFAVGKEILGELLLFVGHEPCEVGLVFGEDAGHKLDVRAVVVGEAAVPRTAEVAVAPGPLFLSGRHMVGSHMKHSGLCIAFVSAFEVIAGVDSHV